MLVDATLGSGVSAQSVWNYCQTRAIRVRRLSDPSIQMGHLANISMQAQRQVGKPYSLLQAIVSKLVPGTTPVPNALYCSREGHGRRGRRKAACTTFERRG